MKNLREFEWWASKTWDWEKKRQEKEINHDPWSFVVARSVARSVPHIAEPKCSFTLGNSRDA